MKFISLDLENSQPEGSIIQIGAAVFDTAAKEPLQDTFNMYVKTSVSFDWKHPLRSNNGTLEQLLGEQFKTEWENKAVPTKEALELFWQWLVKAQAGKKVVQWGRGDLERVMLESRQNEVRYPTIYKMLNLKTAYQFLYQPAVKLPQEYSLERACINCLGKFEGKAHDALCDAVNTGLLLCHIFSEITTYQKVKSLLS